MTRYLVEFYRLLKTFFCVGLSGAFLLACSTSPSPSNCYGRGQLGCEVYWKESPKPVVVGPKVDDDYIKKLKIPDKQKYMDRGETLSAKRWNKLGASDLEIRKALLECGSGGYYGKNAYELMKMLTLSQYDNGLILVKKCMLADGFEYLGKVDICANQSVAACQSDTIAPVRDVNRRINGTYCAEMPYLYECQPQSYERRRNSSYCKTYPQVNLCQPAGQASSPQKNVPVPITVPDSEANHYFEQNRFREQTDKLQQDIQNNSNRQMEKMLRDTAPE